MNIYLTSGTLDYLTRIVENTPGVEIIKMVNADDAMLLHETNGESIFNEPRKYEVLLSEGALEKNGFAALNNIPVSAEGKPLFEYQVKEKIKLIVSEPGIASIRVLRPVSTQTYIILTIWNNEQSFHKWKISSKYQSLLTFESEDHLKEKIFTSTPYVKTYNIIE